jgi:hypothetical protein
MYIIYSIVAIILGVGLFVFTYKEGRKEKASLTVSYVVHLKGYPVSIALRIMGIMMLYRYV